MRGYNNRSYIKNDNNSQSRHAQLYHAMEFKQIDDFENFPKQDLLLALLHVKKNSQGNYRQKHITHQYCQIDYYAGEEQVPSKNNAIALRAYNSGGAPMSPIICGSSYQHPSKANQKYNLHSQRFALYLLFKILQMPIENRNIQQLRFMDMQDLPFQQVSNIFKKKSQYKKVLQQNYISLVFVSDYIACSPCKTFLQYVLPKQSNRKHQYHYLVQRIDGPKQEEYFYLTDYFFRFQESLQSDDSHEPESFQIGQLRAPSVINEQMKKFQKIHNKQVRVFFKQKSQYNYYPNIIQKLDHTISQSQKEQFYHKLSIYEYSSFVDGIITYSQDNKLYDTLIIQINEGSDVKQVLKILKEKIEYLLAEIRCTNLSQENSNHQKQPTMQKINQNQDKMAND